MHIRNYLFIILSILFIGGNATAQFQWTQIGPSEQVVDLTVRGNKTYLLTKQGLYVSTDDIAWQKLRTIATGEGLSSVVVLKSGEILLFSYNYYFISTDAGTNWQKVSQSGFSTRRAASDDKDYIYAGQNDPIKLSTDKGKTWKQSSDGTSNNFFDIGVIAVAPNGDIYAGNQGITGGLVYRSTNHGASWKQVYQRNMEDVVSISFNNGTIFIAFSHTLILSDDNGETWLSRASELPQYLSSVYFYEENDGYVGTYGSGIFYSGDRGLSIDSNGFTGIQGRNVSEIIRTSRGKVLAGTEKGLFIQGVVNSVEDRSIPTLGFTLSPNPAEKETTVSFRTTPNSNLSIEVFDELGRVLISKNSKMQQEKLSLNTSTLKRGMYYVKVSGNNQQHVGKLLIR